MVVPLFVGSREVDQRARRGDGARQRDPPRRAEEGEDQRPDAGRHLRRRHRRHDHPAPASAGRHREGAGRGQAPRAHQALRPERRVLPRARSSRSRSRPTQRRARSADALGQVDVRDVREAQQAHPARDADDGADDRRPGASRRHHRRAPSTLKLNDRQEILETTDPGQAPRAALRADERRDRDPAGREEDPLPRQEADGADAEGVLPQRADAGDSEGARRARRVQERDPGARREAQGEEAHRRSADKRQARS